MLRFLTLRIDNFDSIVTLSIQMSMNGMKVLLSLAVLQLEGDTRHRKYIFLLASFYMSVLLLTKIFNLFPVTASKPINVDTT